MNYVSDSQGPGAVLPVGLIPLASITIPSAGIYHVTATAGVKRDPVVGFFVVGLRQNGGVLAYGTVGFPLRADTDTQANVSGDIPCNAGDVLDVFVTQVSRNTLIAGPSTISAFLVQ